MKQAKPLFGPIERQRIADTAIIQQMISKRDQRAAAEREESEN